MMRTMQVKSIDENKKNIGIPSLLNLFGIMTIVFIMVAIFSMNVSAADNYMVSGRTSISKLTFPQLRALYENRGETSTNLYKTSPSVSNNKVATLTDSTYLYAKNSLNYYRRAAGLNGVTLTTNLNNSAAHGALVVAANGTLTHNPSKTSGMSDSVYEAGKEAASTSNLSYYSGNHPDNVLPYAFRGQMGDSTKSNISTLGHRRWILNPEIRTYGIGMANTNEKDYYTDIRVFGDGTTKSSVSDYNFIAWPASGNNLSDTFAPENPWSISLNPDLFNAPSKSSVKITLKEVSSGKTWTFNNSTNDSTVSETTDYFTVNTQGYGIKYCLIFRPAYSTISEYKGDYIVTVTGLSGKMSSLSYKVTFASLSSISSSDRSVLDDPALVAQNVINASDCNLTASASAQSFTIKATALNSNATFSYTSSNPAVSVDASGKVFVPANFVGTTNISITSAKTSQYGATTKMITVTVNPPKTAAKAVKAAKKQLTFTWTKNKYATGYQVQYSLKKNFSGGKKINIATNKSTTTIRKLTSKKKYYVRIRAYYVENGNRIYGSWSAAKAVKVK